MRKGFLSNLEYTLSKDQYTLTPYDRFLSLSYAVRERIIERWIITQQRYHAVNPKRVYYLSLEFLLGRLLDSNMLNLGLQQSCAQAMANLGFNMEDMIDQESDAGLGNGGLGRLAACFLDSMATLGLPAIGYGIRYEFGIFRQRIVKGHQRELPERWLQQTNPWEIERDEYKCYVRYYGRTVQRPDRTGKKRSRWVDTDVVVAVPYDTPVPGYRNNTVNTLRLWSAHSANEFSLKHFNEGDYIGACEDKLTSENISKVLYPNDSNHSGKELRLKQQYFFTSASLQDIIRRYLKHNDDFSNFADLNAIQLNDTHPAIATVELMRLLIDEHRLEWDQAWNIVVNTFAYTNHTLMPEALEKWPVSMFKYLLPRHLEIIYEINSRFLREVSYQYPGDTARLGRMSLIEEGAEPMVRMAFLAILASHSVNGVAKLHTELLTKGLVKDFYELWPEKFNSKTNGITQRRWLAKCNPPLAALISDRIGDGWVRDLGELKRLAPLADEPAFQQEWQKVKKECRKRLARKLSKWHGIRLNADTMFDVQIKRIHEYKRQLLNAFHCIHLYNRIKSGDTEGFVPRTVLFGGKAAPGYAMAKLSIKFINNVAEVINNDPDAKDLLRVHFVPNYRVTMAELMIPAADLSEQISTAGTEASGTGNMKFALNGALTIGTMDGANIEIREEVGADNIFIFGLNADEVSRLKETGYNPREYYERSSPLKKVIELVSSGFFSQNEPELFQPILDSLLEYGDRFMVLADFDAYAACQEKVCAAYRDPPRWTAMAIRNVASMGRFSSDRTIRQYADEIWNAQPVEVELNR
ncbi:MAG: glycogen/starch/alpha-glucan family phosphorylase [Chitinivibrionales bacterium]|nr:glycogen/starch/alpha-glucan family phosphorylase [Chitinivibrionales bacterium]MBD3394564.1 glycogen/starch/alpha-glucan family phosphorylase [Chitinivibrionales bacterium]